MRYLFLFLWWFSLEATLPLSVYLTWQGNPATTMSVNWVTTGGGEDNTIEYRPIGEVYWIKAVGSSTPMPFNGGIWIHRASLTGLHPETRYEFQVVDRTSRFFQTLPKTLSRPIRFLVGGDIYTGAIADFKKLNIIGAATNPDFVLIGGDITYTGKFSEKEFATKGLNKWLDWLRIWTETMVTPQGNMIPFLPILGNEDVLGCYNGDPSKSPYFYALFPNGGYYVIDCGDYLSIVCLDSGHTHAVDGEQKTWLADTLKNRAAIPHKFALYHVPAWPSRRKFNYSLSVAIREHWVPYFDTYQVAAGFEHHDHCYKRTKCLKNGQIDPQGTVYMGDGTWGIVKPRAPKNHSIWYLEKAQAAQYVLLVTITTQERRYEAMGLDGKVFDTFTQPLHESNL